MRTAFTIRISLEAVIKRLNPKKPGRYGHRLSAVEKRRLAAKEKEETASHEIDEP